MKTRTFEILTLLIVFGLGFCMAGYYSQKLYAHYAAESFDDKRNEHYGK